ncbi:venom serine carboxypeptidase-like [Amblyomma americanum]
MMYRVTCPLSLLLFGALCLGKSKGKPTKEYCDLYLSQPAPFDDAVFYPKSDTLTPRERNKIKNRSRVCLPNPCEDVEAYSGFIPVDDGSDTSFLFFLHLKSKARTFCNPKAPLLLWLQGGPGNSSLFGQFLENGPLGIDASETLYRRPHTLLQNFSIIYLDQPVGSGYSFDEKQQYPSTLNEATDHILRFLRRFVRIFIEYDGSPFYVAGESYGARSALGVAYQMLTAKERKTTLELKGVMLGVGFLFPLLDLVNSAEYLYTSGVLNDNGRTTLAGWFDMIQSRVVKKEYRKAAYLLTRTVLNVPPVGVKTIFELLTGFKHHASIAMTQEPSEIAAYWKYANSVDFKRIVHVNSSRVLDGTRREVFMKLGEGDFFADVQKKLQHVLDNTYVLFYVAEFDAVFPLVNIERCFKKLRWRGSESIKKATRALWHKNDNSSLELFGYEIKVEKLMYSTVLLGGHYISMDRSEAVSEMYSRFLKFQSKKKADQ